MEKTTFTRAELVQFGRQLLKKHNIETGVSHADVENYTGEVLETCDYVVLSHHSEGGIQSIQRKPDGTVFQIGERVSNGGPMCGKIIKITTDQAVNNPDGTDATIWTDYSGVGMNLASVSHVPTLPCRFQYGQAVAVNLPGFFIKHAVVIKAHFPHNGVQYDLQIWWKIPGEGDCSTRIYNVDEQILEGVI